MDFPNHLLQSSGMLHQAIQSFQPYLLQSYGSTAGLQSFMQSWQSSALIALAAIFFFFTIVYMLGRALSLENVKKWASSEFMQVFASAILIILLVSLVNYASYFAIGFIIGEKSGVSCGGEVFDFGIQGLSQDGGQPQGTVQIQGNPVSFAKCRIQEKITDLDRRYYQIFNANKEVEAKSQFCWSLAGVQVYCGDWYLRKEVEQAHLLGSKITPLLIHLHGQYAFLEYIEANMLSIFLPLGIILRSIPLTRGAGGLLIAIAIGFYFLLPSFYVVFDPTFIRGSGTPDSIPVTKVFNSCYPGFSGASVLLDELNSKLDIINGNYELLSSELAKLTVGVVFYPFLALSLCLVFVRFMAPIFGGDASEIMKMVSKVL